jgi:transaldolase
MNKIEIYYDGVDVKNNCGDMIKGFTTNITFMKDAGITDYDGFIKEQLRYSNGRPISFQIYDDTDDEIEASVKKISSYDRSIFVKIPVIKIDGTFNSGIIKKLHNEKVQVNVTAIFTKSQIDSLKECFDKDTKVIISVFGGRINDSGLDCSDVVKYAKDAFISYPNVKILWAACRTIYNMFEAENQGADIVTVPDTVLKRIYRIGEDPQEASLKQVNQFRQDGLVGKITLA